MSMARVDPIRTEPASTVQPAGRRTRDRTLRLDESLRMFSTYECVLDGVGMIRGAAAQTPNLRFAGAEHAMRTTLINPADEAHLDRFGFAVVDFLDERLIEELSAVHDEIGEAPDDPGMALYFGFHSKSTDYKWRAHNRLSEMLAAKAAETFDRHDIYLAIFITKWPGPNSGFGPHQDPTLLDERSFRGVTLWAPLTATGRSESGIDNGMLHVVPGSHRFAQYARVRDVNQWIYAEVESEILTKHGVGIPTRPGEAIVFDDRLIHYSAPNATDTPRVVVSLGVRPQETTCVLVRANDAGAMSLYEVEDASFIDVTASAQHLWLPDGEPIATLDPPPAQMSAADFAAHCEAVERPACVVEPTRIEPSAGKVSVDPDLFCAFCGATEDLVDPDRSGKGKAQLQCNACRSEREAETARTLLVAPTTWAPTGKSIPKAVPPTSVLRSLRADRRLRKYGFSTMPLIDPTTAGNLRTWYLERHAEGIGFVADLNDDDGMYRRDVRQVLGPSLDQRLTAAFRGYEPFLYNFLCKWPGPESTLYLHQDWMYIDERPERSTFVVWIPLQDVLGHNGQLQVLRGSHRLDRSLRGTDLTADWIDHDGIIRPRLESVPVGVGTAVIMNNSLVHCSYPNNTSEPRVVAAVGMRPRKDQLNYFRRSAKDEATRYEVTEDFFCEYTPAHLFEQPPKRFATPVERIRIDPPALTEQQLARALDGL